jgi:hypothetical protein
VSRRLLLELPVGVIPCVARTAVSRSHRAVPGLTMYGTEDKLDTRGHITIRMTCVAMSALCSHGAYHSPFTVHLAAAVIPHRLDHLKPDHPLPVPTPYPPSAPALDMGARSSPAGSGSSNRSMSVFMVDPATSSRGSLVRGLGGSGSLGS